MAETWTIIRIKSETIYGIRPDRTTFEYPQEDWLIGKGKTLQDALDNFKFNEGMKHEIPTPRPRNPRGFYRWG